MGTSKKTKKNTAYYLIIFFFGWVLLSATAMMAETPKDMGGWEEKSPYNKLYKAQELDKFRANIVKIKERTPMKGMSPAVIIYVQEAKGEELIPVHLCPVWYMDRKSTGLKKGDRVKIRGSWAEIRGADVFMASKIKRGDHFELKVRLTKDGKPFWTMSPEELKKETRSP